MNSSTNDNPRYHLIDAIRGITLVSMVLFHFCYDVFIVYGRDLLWYDRPFSHIWQQSICCTFILISGFVWRWGGGASRQLKRGLLLNVCGLIITTVTAIVIPSEIVWFGILNFMGCAVWLVVPIDGLLERRTTPRFWIGLILCIVLFYIFRHTQNGYLQFGTATVALPRVLYDCKVLTPFGFPFTGFRSSDYFPILPWFFLYLCGYFLEPILMRFPQVQKIATIRVPFFSAVGKYTLWIYMLHQPVCMLICEILF